MRREGGLPILGTAPPESVPMRRMVIVFDPNSNQMGLAENDFDTFQALAALEAVKAMILADWLKATE